jgi:uncharacterized protein with von Willebrand factor type A (vWA) domain
VLAHFILALRNAGIPASITEYLALLRGMKEGVADYNVDDFYHLSRAALVKDERHLDRFDRVFGEVFKGLEQAEGEGFDELCGSCRRNGSARWRRSCSTRRRRQRSRRPAASTS